ncbi:flagellin N-terminal helical domain-containing protein [Anaerosporobacter faecicola]|uniref:flagellin N-terminal helical domain-containing protein n=1 Tax=Anaerosporobacter faecicola TaxID=2718714 RepID=UPI001439F878|nr:flagellin [Anaerosporobacter faecicola]
MILQYNQAAATAARYYGINSNRLCSLTEKLSSGYRINRASDDAADLQISEKMRAQIRGLNQASRNAQDGISMLQTADGALAETESIVQRMRELCVQAANDTNASEDRDAIQKELDQLAKEITRISNDTEFNTKKLLDGSASDSHSGSSTEEGIKLQIGANKGQSITINIESSSASDLGIDNLSVKDHDEAGDSIEKCDKALKKVSSNRSTIGAYENRLEHTISNLDNTAENLQDAESRIRDLDMAKAMVEYAKVQILMQAGQAMIAQANQSQKGILTLLQG